jgi:phthalate 4,5-dioxygenase oxygenase subunit
VHSKNIPGTYRPVANMDNDYLMNREKQRTGEWFSGIEGIAIQDSSLQESMGPIVDRTKERLVPADSGIIKARQKLYRAATALRDKGVTPPGVDPAHHHVRSAAVVLPQKEAFLDAASEDVKVRPGMPVSSV